MQGISYSMKLEQKEIKAKWINDYDIILSSIVNSFLKDFLQHEHENEHDEINYFYNSIISIALKDLFKVISIEFIDNSKKISENIEGTQVKGYIDYYLMNPDIQIDPLATLCKNLSEFNLEPQEIQKQGIIFEESLYKWMKSNDDIFTECSHLFLYSLRNEIKEFNNKKQYSCIKYDGVFISKKDIDYCYYNGLTAFNVNVYDHQQEEIASDMIRKDKPFIINKDEMIIIDIKQKYNLYYLAMFINKVIEQKILWKSFNLKKIHCLFFYEHNRNTLEIHDILFLRFLMKDGLYQDIWSELDKEAVLLDKQEEYCQHKPNLEASFNIFKDMAKKNEIAIDFIYYDTLAFYLLTKESNTIEQWCMNMKQFSNKAIDLTEKKEKVRHDYY